jgi:DNA polymerase elongation subunit (family B)
MPKLIFDIETAGEDFSSLDKVTQKELLKWIERTLVSGSDEYKKAVEKAEQDLVFSPLTSQIVAIGVLDYEKDAGVVYFQSPGEKNEEFKENNVSFRSTTEKEMLERFWQGANGYDEFISFNGRSFDVPFLMIRSAINNVRPTKDLMSHRYIESQKFGAVHVDLYDQLSFYGALRKGSLHLYTRAFGIESPKGEGITGDDVTRLFGEKKYVDIARYNSRDLFATKKLYEYWDAYLRF